MDITDFGSPASIATLGVAILIALVGFIRWLHGKYLTKKPVNLEYYIDSGEKAAPSESDIRTGIAQQGIKGNLKPAKEKIIIGNQEKYTIILELKAKKSCDIYHVELRFFGKCKKPPKITNLKDISSQSTGLEIVCSEYGGGIILKYIDELHASGGRGSKAMYFFATFETFDCCKGKLSMRIETVGWPVAFSAIPCLIKKSEKGKF